MIDFFVDNGLFIVIVVCLLIAGTIVWIARGDIN